MQFEFATANRIIFGAGKLREAGPLAKELGRCALVVTGRDAARAKPLLAILKEHTVDAATFPVSGEPELETVRQGVAAARKERCDFVIGFGGGSAIDAAKAIAALLANAGDVLDYVEIIGGGKTLGQPSVPVIAIPTTAGTGAEVTRNSVLASPEHRFKVSLRSAFMLPRAALVDPELTYDLPQSLTASTGLDALTQLIEPYVCVRANPITDAICTAGIKRAARSLRAAFVDGRNTAAREDVALASLFGGLALANAGLGAVHGLAGPLGGLLSAPHGALCAALLPQVMEANLRALEQRASDNPALARYGHIAGWLTGDANASANDGVAWVRQLVADLKIPALKSHGLERGQFAVVVENAVRASSMKANPIPLTAEELTGVLERAF